MSYLLDTNVISETTRPVPDGRVLAWLQGIDNLSLHLSVLSISEIRKGLELAPEGARREYVRNWLETVVLNWFGDRILPISIGIADRWGRIVAQAGRSVPIVDSLIAAIALHHDLRLVTRNENDFHYPGLIVINPWRM